MASQGYFVAAVEHRDGSAAATMVVNDGVKEFIYERKLQPGEKVGYVIFECPLPFLSNLSV